MSTHEILTFLTEVQENILKINHILTHQQIETENSIRHIVTTSVTQVELSIFSIHPMEHSLILPGKTKGKLTVDSYSSTEF
jgi:hypothetical protein